MAALPALWLPILISAVAVLAVSSIIHMTPLWHKSDYPRSPQEDRVMDALRSLGLPPGDYYMPRPANTAEMRSPEFKEKMKRGPNVLMTIMAPSSGSIAKPLSLWFVYCLAVSVLAAFIAGSALYPGNPNFKTIFHYVTSTAFIGYAVALWQMSIWYQRAWSLTLKATLDGVIYALVTGAVFGLMWPH